MCTALINSLDPCLYILCETSHEENRQTVDSLAILLPKRTSYKKKPLKGFVSKEEKVTALINSLDPCLCILCETPSEENRQTDS